MYEAIVEKFGVEPKVGEQVRLVETGALGIISNEDVGMPNFVMVKFKGDHRALPFHPSALEFLGPVEEGQADG